MVQSASATSCAPGTLIENVLPACTVPVYVLPFTVSVTVSPTFASPPTVPVRAVVPPASPALLTPRAVMLLTAEGGAAAVRSTVYDSASPAVPVLPAASVVVTEAWIVQSASATSAAP